MKITPMMEIAEIAEIKALAERMCSFVEGAFDGYPSATCADERIVFEAHAAWKSFTDDSSISQSDFVVFFPCVCVETREELENALAFYEAFMNATWDRHMCEGDNKAYADQAKEESGG